jgi:hypothetical protein
VPRINGFIHFKCFRNTFFSLPALKKWFIESIRTTVKVTPRLLVQTHNTGTKCTHSFKAFRIKHGRGKVDLQYHAFILFTYSAEYFAIAFLLTLTCRSALYIH